VLRCSGLQLEQLGSPIKNKPAETDIKGVAIMIDRLNTPD